MMPQRATRCSPEDARMRASAMKAPLLSREEEYELACAWRDRKDPDAFKRLVTAHQKLVVGVAARFKRYSFPLGDLVNEGNMGLMEAVNRFDPEMGNRLSTYAQLWVLTFMQNYVQNNLSPVRIGRSRSERLGIRRIMRGDGDDEATSDGKVTLDTVQRLRGAMATRCVSLNATYSEDGEGEEFISGLADENETPERIFDECMNKTRHSVLREVLKKLDERELIILKERYMTGERRTLKEVSARLEISPERVRQIERGALKKMRKWIASAGYRAPDLIDIS